MTPLERSLSNITPDAQTIRFIEVLRDSAKAYGAILEETPPSRERSLAITNLEQSLMWAVKGLVLSSEDQ